jgi:CHAT domain-containing protein
LFVNTNHKQSISRGRAKPQGQTARPAVSPLVTAALVVTGWSVSATAGETSCSKALGAPATPAAALKTLGTDPSEAELAVSPGHTYLIEVAEHGNDALVELLDAKNQLIARADHPERRTGTRRAIVTVPGAGRISVRVTGKEHAQVDGTATVSVFDLAAITARADCLVIFKGLAQADADYAAGQEISRGRSTSPTASARDAFQRAADEYAMVVRALTAVGDRGLRGQTQLALAGVEYFDLQDWAKAADWATTAAEALRSDDTYRRARAETLLAQAWIEIGRSASVSRSASEHDLPPAELFTRARNTLQRLSRWHLQRGETYDAGLQLTNIALTYLYQSHFTECVATSEGAGRLFGLIHETPRRAQAWQNTALCLWGLGRMPEARRWLARALAEVGPEPYPTLYLGVINNTALVDYALGHFDESLSLFDRALRFARERQYQRDEAQSLNGIGLDYYALGDRQRAHEFLERALAIRSVALDRRGRVATLRALANADAEQGRVDEAIAFDREALSLAVAPASIERITIQLAAHTAAAGRLDDAKAQLDDVVATGTKTDPIIRAEAHLQRGVLLRKLGRFSEARDDLDGARTRLHQLGSLSEEFAADLELARTLRSLREPDAALASIDRALSHSDAIRLQTANPELRLGLETPLRAAYELKIELLRARYEEALRVGLKKEAAVLATAAFTTADSSRARTLADVAAQQYAPATRQALASEFHRREALYQELAGRRYELNARFDRAGSNDARAKHLLSDIAELERQVDTINALIAGHAAPRGGPAGAARGERGLPEVPANSAVVSYWIGSESAYAWVVRPQEIQWTRLPPPTAITDRATTFYRSLTRFVDVAAEHRLEDGRALYELILRPIEPSLADVWQWLVIPDGALDYVPFAALRASGSGAAPFVVMQHDIALTPAAWMLAAGERPMEPRDGRALLMVADPVYQPDDPRLAAVKGAPARMQVSVRSAPDSPHPDYQRLGFTAEEAAGIVAQFPSADVDQLIGLDATRERLLMLDWSRYRFVHIATHGTVDAQVPELSALVLGSYDAGGNAVDGAVRVADLSLRTLRADVAVFSACDTALGKEVPSEGLVGIGSIVLARGARAVVASLWPVADEIGAHLMTEFYQHLLHDSMSPPAALGAAMRSVVSRDGSTDPALWAAYQVSVVALGPGLPVRDTGTGRSLTTNRP